MTVKILLECTREQQISIENECVEQGVKISDYLINLHEHRKSENEAKKQETSKKTNLLEENTDIKTKRSKKKIN